MANIHYLVVINECGTWVMHNSFKDLEEAEFEIDSERQSGVKAKDIKRVNLRLCKGQRLKQSNIDEVLSQLNSGSAKITTDTLNIALAGE